MASSTDPESSIKVKAEVLLTDHYSRFGNFLQVSMCVCVCLITTSLGIMACISCNESSSSLIRTDPSSCWDKESVSISAVADASEYHIVISVVQLLLVLLLFKDVVRGSSDSSGSQVSLLSHLYTLMRSSKSQRRAFLKLILRHFEDYEVCLACVLIRLSLSLCRKILLDSCCS